MTTTTKPSSIAINNNTINRQTPGYIDIHHDSIQDLIAVLNANNNHKGSLTTNATTPVEDLQTKRINSQTTEHNYNYSLISTAINSRPEDLQEILSSTLMQNNNNTSVHHNYNNISLPPILLSTFMQNNNNITSVHHNYNNISLPPIPKQLEHILPPPEDFIPNNINNNVTSSFNFTNMPFWNVKGTNNNDSIPKAISETVSKKRTNSMKICDRPLKRRKLNDNDDIKRMHINNNKPENDDDDDEDDTDEDINMNNNNNNNKSENDDDDDEDDDDDTNHTDEDMNMNNNNNNKSENDDDDDDTNHKRQYIRTNAPRHKKVSAHLSTIEAREQHFQCILNNRSCNREINSPPESSVELDVYPPPIPSILHDNEQQALTQYRNLQQQRCDEPVLAQNNNNNNTHKNNKSNKSSISLNRKKTNRKRSNKSSLSPPKKKSKIQKKPLFRVNDIIRNKNGHQKTSSSSQKRKKKSKTSSSSSSSQKRQKKSKTSSSSSSTQKRQKKSKTSSSSSKRAYNRTEWRSSTRDIPNSQDVWWIRDGEENKLRCRFAEEDTEIQYKCKGGKASTVKYFYCPFKPATECNEKVARSNLFVHQVKCLQLKLFTCQICQDSFSKPEHLKNHSSVHQPDMNLQCKHCKSSQRYRCQRTLDAHVRDRCLKNPKSKRSIEIQKKSTKRKKRKKKKSTKRKKKKSKKRINQQKKNSEDLHSCSLQNSSSLATTINKNNNKKKKKNNDNPDFTEIRDQDLTPTTDEPPSYYSIKQNIFVSREKKKWKDLKESDKFKCQCNEGCYEDQCENYKSQMECVEGRCGIQAKSSDAANFICNNRKFQQKQWKDVEVKPAGKKGWGLFTKENIKRGEFIIEYVGEIINEEECKQRLSTKYLTSQKYFIIHLEGNDSIDATTKGGPARFMNHSCNANCTANKWIVGVETSLGLFAKENIEKGQELTFDYQYQRSGKIRLKCHCGSKDCRGSL